ncbi:MAG: helix-turn-helix domain-containing protein [Pseudomonadota bacterium]
MDVSTSLDRPRAYGVKDFCRIYGVSRSTTYNLIAAGKLRSVRIAGRRLIPTDAAEALLNSRAG